MLVVQKYGGSSVANAERIFNVAKRISETYDNGNDVVVILSAQGDTTDDLIAKAAEINPDASRREMDMLLSTGEQQSVALMAMALDKMGYIIYYRNRIYPIEEGCRLECYDVDFYHKENGDCPVDDFLESLDTKMRAKVLGAVALLEANGPQLREPYSKFIGDGIFEIRAKQSNNITRVLYFFYIGKRIVLTNGFIKKTQKTPPEEIALAKKYRADYLERKEKIS